MSSKQQSRHEYRSFLSAFFSVSAVLLIACAAVNLAADPYGGWQSGLLPTGYESSVTRIGKAERLHRFEGSTVLIGNSRTRVGIDPNGPGIVKPPALNLGLSGASWSEITAVAQRVLERPTVTNVILLLDYNMFLGDSAGKGDFANSRFQPHVNEFEHRCDLLFNAHSLGDSIENLLQFASGKPPSHSQDGFTIPERMPPAKQFSVASTKKLLRSIDAYRNERGEETFRRERVDQLGGLVSACEGRGVKLTVVLTPLHVDYLEVLWQHGQAEDYFQWLRQVCRTVEASSDGDVPVWDFAGWFEPNCEPLLAVSEGTKPRWYWEPSHFRAELGDEVLSRIHGLPSADQDFGRRLQSADVDSYAIEVAARRNRWLEASSREAIALQQLLPDSISVANYAEQATERY